MMDLFSLPLQTKVNKTVPKNAFESFTNAKQKALFSSLISKIIWSNKLSEETLNLPGKEIKEIQLFKVELKGNGDPKPLLEIIDKAIPYHIIFIVSFGKGFFLSTAKKHPHPTNENFSVIDWTFKSDWLEPEHMQFNLNLKKSIDSIYLDFCNQLSGKSKINQKSFGELIELNSKTEHLKKEITRLKSAISNCKQFNQKVELNLRLKEVVKELKLHWTI